VILSSRPGLGIEASQGQTFIALALRAALTIFGITLKLENFIFFNFAVAILIN